MQPHVAIAPPFAYAPVAARRDSNRSRLQISVAPRCNVPRDRVIRAQRDESGGGSEATDALLLRLILVLGDPTPDVVRQCYISFLNLSPLGRSRVCRTLPAIPRSGGPARSRLRARSEPRPASNRRAERVLAGSRRLVRDTTARVISLGASPQAEAAAFLVHVIEETPSTSPRLRSARWQPAAFGQMSATGRRRRSKAGRAKAHSGMRPGLWRANNPLTNRPLYR